MCSSDLKGFARVGIGLITTVLGLICGVWFYGVAGGWLRPYLKSVSLANLIGFFLIFIGICAAGALVGRALTAIFKWVGLSWLNRFMGGVFGLVRGALVAAIVLMLFVAFAPDGPPRAAYNSKLAPYLIGGAEVMVNLAPKELRDGFWDGYEKIRRAWWEPVEKRVIRPPAKEI